MELLLVARWIDTVLLQSPQGTTSALATVTATPTAAATATTASTISSFPTPPPSSSLSDFLSPSPLRGFLSVRARTKDAGVARWMGGFALAFMFFACCAEFWEMREHGAADEQSREGELGRKVEEKKLEGRTEDERNGPEAGHERSVDIERASTRREKPCSATGWTGEKTGLLYSEVPVQLRPVTSALLVSSYFFFAVVPLLVFLAVLVLDPTVLTSMGASVAVYTIILIHDHLVFRSVTSSATAPQSPVSLYLAYLRGRARATYVLQRTFQTHEFQELLPVWTRRERRKKEDEEEARAGVRDEGEVNGGATSAILGAAFTDARSGTTTDAGPSASHASASTPTSPSTLNKSAPPTPAFVTASSSAKATGSTTASTPSKIPKRRALALKPTS